MSVSAIIMLIVSILVVWGGLAVAVVLLLNSKNPGDPSFHRDL